VLLFKELLVGRFAFGNLHSFNLSVTKVKHDINQSIAFSFTSVHGTALPFS